jgi:SH3-like domain-containing protein
VPTLPPSGLQTGVIRPGGGGAVYVRRVAGIQSPDDALLPDGSPVLVSASSEIQVSGQTWRSVRGLNGVAGWVPSSMVSVDGQAAPPNANPGPLQAASVVREGERAVVVNTDGEGVALRRSARPDDRMPTGLTEGTQVSVLERAGSEMARVRADNGQEGWVPAQYLAPSI